MTLRIDIRYSDEERRILERAVSEANRALEQLWTGRGRKYSVGYIELSATQYDERLDEMVRDPLHYLAADAREA